MLKKRIIPVILTDGVVALHTVQFGAPQSMGGMQQVLSVYERRNVDELVILDILATPQKRGPAFERFAEWTHGIFAPLAYGGGVKTIGDALRVIRAGADKVIIGKAATHALISRCAAKFGSQSVTVAIDAPCSADSPDLDSVLLDCIWAEERGAGEILLTSVKKQGMREGYDCALIGAIAKTVKIPVIANGGAGHPSHMLAAFEAGAHAVAASSMFSFTAWTPKEAAEWLHQAGVEVRRK